MKKLMIAAAIAALATFPAHADDLSDIKREVVKHHDEAVKRLQE